MNAQSQGTQSQGTQSQGNQSQGAHAAGPRPAETAPAGQVPDAPAGAQVETAGAFDIRTFIGALLGLFGVILIVWGLVAFTADEAARTGGVNANLWAGLGMLVVAILFIAWARLKPIRILVQQNEPGAEEPRDISAL